MKKLIKIIMVSLWCVTFYACKKDVETSTPVENGAISSSIKGDSIIHTLTIDGNLNYVVEVDGIYYFAEDIIISKEQFNALKKLTADLSTQERSTIVQDFASTWPNAKAYYQYPDPTTMTSSQYNSFVSTINTALGNITTNTGIQFEERTTQTEYLKFVKSTGNNSPLGWQKNRVNTINLYNYNHIGITIHEVMHSLGIMHEQCRPDRDQYVIVDLTKVQSGYEHNYNLYTNYGGHGNFDFGSIMLYSSTSFAIDNNQPPMTKLDGSTFTGQRAALSAGDIEGLKSLYFPMDVSGVYRITPSSVGTKSLDIFGGNPADGTRVIIWPSHQSNNQRFIFTKVEHGYYQIKSVLDPAKVLTVRNGATVSGTQVELRTNTNANHQKFKLFNRGNLGFGLAPLHASGLRLELSGQSTADGTNIVVSTFNTNSQAQRFNLTKF